jgi:hypothetical protein
VEAARWSFGRTGGVPGVPGRRLFHGAGWKSARRYPLARVPAIRRLRGRTPRGPELASEPGFIDSQGRVRVSGPGAAREQAQRADDQGGEKAVGVGLGEDEADVGQEGEGEILVGRGFGIEQVEGVESALGPGAAGDLGNGEEGAPNVGDAIEGGLRENGVTGGKGVEVIGGPAGEFASQDGFGLGVERVPASADLAGLGGNEGDEDGAIAECAGQCADAGEGGRGKGVEGTDDFTFDAKGAAAAFVTGVEEAAEFVVVEVAAKPPPSTSSPPWSRARYAPKTSPPPSSSASSTLTNPPSSSMKWMSASMFGRPWLFERRWVNRPRSGRRSGRSRWRRRAGLVKSLRGG